MPLRFLLDEHLRGVLWRAIQRHNARGAEVLDVLRVGDPPDLALGSSDAEILAWAEREGRILISRDETTLPGHLADHLRAGGHSPGIFLLRHHAALAQVVAFLAVASSSSDPSEWQDRIEYIP